MRESKEFLADKAQRFGAVYSPRGPFLLDSGLSLSSVDIAYTTHGELNSNGSNAILVCHALTGNAHAANAILPNGETMHGWFNGVIGRGKALDTDRYFVICSNVLGSCYGSTGPTSIDPATGRRYQSRFPQVTVRDMVRAQKLLLDHLGVCRLVTVIGGSLGGMQVLEWGVMYPDFVQSIVPIATSARHSAWCIGISETQRLAIMSDPAWLGGEYAEQPARGLAIARSIAMIWYRSRVSFEERFGRTEIRDGDGHERNRLFAEQPEAFSVESYLRYQGQKLVDRFDANTYILLTRVMDIHDLGAGRGTLKEVLGSISALSLSIGISSDVLYPADEQKEIAHLIPRSSYVELTSPFGHDAFLIAFDAMNAILQQFLGTLPRVPAA